jgi:PHP family Zn ribbon phosphoesterase
MHRVENLSDREEGFVPDGAIPFRYVIPLIELIAWSQGQSSPTASADREYKRLVQQREEFALLLYEDRDTLLQICPSFLANAIIKVREGRVKIEPGFDGVFGKIEVLYEEGEEQLSLF